MTRRTILAYIAAFAALCGVFAWYHTRAPQRPEYVLINETDQHDFDLAFRMSLKLAEKTSGIENVLVLLKSLLSSKTIEQAAADLVACLQIGTRHNGRGILYLYAAKENLFKIEASYALEGDIPDIFFRRLEEAAKTYMLSEVPQDFISELIFTTNLRRMGTQDETGAVSQPRWLVDEFLSGGAGDPQLPLLTEGSQVFRAVVPRNKAQQRRSYEFFMSSGAFRLMYAGNLGLAVPGPGKSNLPVVLRRGTDGLWQVYEAKA